MSVESFDERRAVARARAGLLPLDIEGIGLSDPLLVLPSGPDLPGSRDEAVARMLATTAIGDSQLAVYWEVYGVVAGWPLRVTLSVEGERPGFMTRALRALRIRSAPEMPEVSWEQAAAAVTEPMAMDVDIGNLADAEYALKIEVTGPYGLVATGEREFIVDRSR